MLADEVLVSLVSGVTIVVAMVGQEVDVREVISVVIVVYKVAAVVERDVKVVVSEFVVTSHCISVSMLSSGQEVCNLCISIHSMLFAFLKTSICRFGNCCFVIGNELNAGSIKIIVFIQIVVRKVGKAGEFTHCTRLPSHVQNRSHRSCPYAAYTKNKINMSFIFENSQY